MRIKRISFFMALVFLISAMSLPMTAFAAGGKDTTPPTLTAVLDGETVKIESSDDNSGVEAVYIDENRVNSLTDGKASVALKDYAGTDKKVSVYAVDYAGNRSDAVKFDNPYYKEPEPMETPAVQSVQSQASSSGSTGSQSGNSGSGASSTGSASSSTVTQSSGNGGTENSGSSSSDPSETVSSIPEGAFTRKAPARYWTRLPVRETTNSFIPSQPKGEMCSTSLLTGNVTATMFTF